MPKIFSADKRQMLYNLLKQNSLILIRENGYKGFNIRDLTRITGISAGTFYNFYHSKEDLILELIYDCQERLQEQFVDIYKTSGSISRKEFISLYYAFFVTDKNNILQYLSRDDLTALFLGSDKRQSSETVKNIMIKNIDYLNSPKKSINCNAVINLTQLINLCIQNKDLLIGEELTNTIKKLLENIADEIFEKEI